MLKNALTYILTIGSLVAYGQNLKLARLKYNGGGDWYVSPTALPNLAAFCNQQLNTTFATDEAVVEVGSPDIFNYSFIHMTGHGNVAFTMAEAQNLRNYLIAGGFLNINDSYGMFEFIKTELKKVFPELELVELPNNHPIYHQKFSFPQGMPKIHEHDNKAPKGYGLIFNGRLVCLLNTESDIGDGWESPGAHNDSPETRLKALRMGANIIMFAFFGNDPISQKK